MNTKISVVMSIHNNNRYLAESIESVLSQSFGDFEFLIVDDASTDGASETLETYASKDSRIVLIKNEVNIGLTKSLNKTLKIAKGEYIARMDGDDICLLDRFQKQVEYLDVNSNVALVFSGTILIDKDSKEVCPTYKPESIEKVLRNLEIHNYIPHPSVMFRRTIVLALGGYDETWKKSQDRNLWIRMRDSGYLFGCIDKILLKYRINPDSVRGMKQGNYWFEVAKHCIWNNSSRGSFRYWNKLTILQKFKLLIRVFIPFRVYLRGVK